MLAIQLQFEDQFLKPSSEYLKRIDGLLGTTPPSLESLSLHGSHIDPTEAPQDDDVFPTWDFSLPEGAPGGPPIGSTARATNLEELDDVPVTVPPPSLDSLSLHGSHIEASSESVSQHALESLSQHASLVEAPQDDGDTDTDLQSDVEPPSPKKVYVDATCSPMTPESRKDANCSPKTPDVHNVGCFAMTPDTRSVACSPIRPEEHITEEDLIQEEMNDLEPEIFVESSILQI